MRAHHRIPIALAHGRSATITPPWFVDESEYSPQPASFKLLVNGEEAFGAVHRAIAAATRSVDIICWAFQPSMHLLRDAQAPCIGDLLLSKADKGVRVRILCFAVQPANVLGKVLDESNTPGRWQLRLGDRPPTSTDAQYDYDKRWFALFDRDQNLLSRAANHGALGSREAWRNIEFRSRGFSLGDRAGTATSSFEDAELPFETRATLAAAPSHHQKTVLIDHEDPERALGFLMGHNFLDHYWDTNAHSAQRHFRLYGQPDPAPNRRANGAYPLHDFSCRLSGPVLGDLYLNFAHAWEREIAFGSSLRRLPRPDFSAYPLRTSDVDVPIVGQILRTQPQYGVKDVMKSYLQAVNNVSQFIHIENQYFRWPPLAEKIKASVAAQLARGRDPAAHGAIHLFVLTNSSDAGIGAGTVNTYRMLQSLGRADALPGVARQERLDAIAAQRKALAARETQVQRQIKALDQQHSMVPVTNAAVARQRAERYAPLNRELEDIRAQQRALDEEEARLQGQGSLARQDDELKAARAQTTALEQERDTLRKRGADTTEIDQRLDQARGRERALQQAYDEELGQTIPPEDIPGLKCHLCTLVAPDTAAGEDWVEVYIHAKLMIVDDAYMTLGSSNINTRSMEVDTEINIAHDRPEVTRPARLQLWASHTNGSGAQVNAREAFEKWGKMMDENADRRLNLAPPIAQLAPFLRTSEERKASD